MTASKNCTLAPAAPPALISAVLTVLLAIGCDDRPSEAASAEAPAASTAAAAPAAASTPSRAAAAPAKPAAPSATEAGPPEAVAAQHVLIAYRGANGAPKSVRRTKAQAEKLAQEVAAKAKGGEDFSALVAQYSEDPGSKGRLGSVGRFRRDAMVRPFSDAAFALKVNETSAPVETKFGFHVIKRNQ